MVFGSLGRRRRAGPVLPPPVRSSSGGPAPQQEIEPRVLEQGYLPAACAIEPLGLGGLSSTAATRLPGRYQRSTVTDGDGADQAGPHNLVPEWLAQQQAIAGEEVMSVDAMVAAVRTEPAGVSTVIMALETVAMTLHAMLEGLMKP